MFIIRAPATGALYHHPTSPITDENTKAPQSATAFRRLACERHM
jgi:hypothetical protein